MEGFLSKQSSGLLKTFQRRFFRLESLKLRYYDSPSSFDAKDEINLLSCMSVAVDAKNLTDISLELAARTYVLRADSKKEAEAWVDCLKVFVQSKHPEVPKRVEIAILACVEVVKKQGKLVEGCFRVSGEGEEVRKMYTAVLVEGSNAVKDGDVFVVANVVKKLLRNLPESVFTNLLVDNFLAKSDAVSLKSLLKQLPASNLAIVSSLASMCKEFVENVNVTRMDIQQLATCLGPNLSDTTKDPRPMNNFTNLINSLITHFVVLFQPIVNKNANDDWFKKEDKKVNEIKQEIKIEESVVQPLEISSPSPKKDGKKKKIVEPTEEEKQRERLAKVVKPLPEFVPLADPQPIIELKVDPSPNLAPISPRLMSAESTPNSSRRHSNGPPLPPRFSVESKEKLSEKLKLLEKENSPETNAVKRDNVNVIKSNNLEASNVITQSKAIEKPALHAALGLDEDEAADLYDEQLDGPSTTKDLEQKARLAQVKNQQSSAVTNVMMLEQTILNLKSQVSLSERSLVNLKQEKEVAVKCLEEEKTKCLSFQNSLNELKSKYAVSPDIIILNERVSMEQNIREELNGQYLVKISQLTDEIVALKARLSSNGTENRPDSNKAFNLSVTGPPGETDNDKKSRALSVATSKIRSLEQTIAKQLESLGEVDSLKSMVNSLKSSLHTEAEKQVEISKIQANQMEECRKVTQETLEHLTVTENERDRLLIRVKSLEDSIGLSKLSVKGDIEVMENAYKLKLEECNRIIKELESEKNSLKNQVDEGRKVFIEMREVSLKNTSLKADLAIKESQISSLKSSRSSQQQTLEAQIIAKNRIIEDLRRRLDSMHSVGLSRSKTAPVDSKSPLQSPLSAEKTWDENDIQDPENLENGVSTPVTKRSDSLVVGSKSRHTPLSNSGSYSRLDASKLALQSQLESSKAKLKEIESRARMGLDESKRRLEALERELAMDAPSIKYSNDS